MQKRGPAFQFYPDKWLSHTNRLSAPAYRVYHRILCWMWLESETGYSMPSEPGAISVLLAIPISEVKEALEEIQNPHAKLLKMHGNNLCSEGLRKEAEKQVERRKQAATAANHKWDIEKQRMRSHKATDANASIPQCFPSPSSSPSPDQTSSGGKHGDSDTGQGCARKGPSRESIARSPIAGLIPDREEAQEALLDTILGITREPHWREWWRVVLERLAECDGTSDFLEALHHVGDAQDPVQARLKDIGAFNQPEHWLVQQAQEVLRAKGVRWPKWPTKPSSTVSVGDCLAGMAGGMNSRNLQPRKG